MGKRDTILVHLRNRIVRGQHPIGSRLPTCAELAQSYDVNLKTMQAALGGLLRDGFIVTQGRRGTFVSHRPPHLFRFGLVLRESPAQLDSGSTAHFPRFLCQRVNELLRAREGDFTIYTDVAGHLADPATQRLAADVKAHRLAGLIFATPMLARTAFFRELAQSAGIPCVALTSVGAPDLHEFGSVMLPRGPLTDRAVETLARQGRRRLAVLSISFQSDSPEDIAQYHTSAKAHGMTLAPGQLLGTVPMSATFTRFAVHALLNAREAPDALFITDDSLISAAAEALIEAGVRVPDDIAVVAHTNFPYATPTTLPFRRVGYDVCRAVDECISLANRIRQDGRPPEPVHLPVLVDQVANA